MAKVNITTADNVEFGKLRWWSNWIDIAVVDWAGTSGFLIQMKISRTNAKKFKAIKLFNRFGENMTSHQISDLTQMKTKDSNND